MLIGRKPIGTLSFMGGVPAVLTKFCTAWGKLIQYTMEFVCSQNETIHLDEANISFHSWARNDLANRMLGDWILFLDTDHEFDPDLLARMLHRVNEHNIDVLVGLYQFKFPPYPPVLYAWQGDGMVVIGDWGDKSHIWEVAGAGGGCLFVKRKVFDRIRNELSENPFDVIGQGGEDLSFFRRLKKLGIKAFVDDRIECKHLIIKSIGLEDYDKTQAEMAPLPDTIGYIPDGNS